MLEKFQTQCQFKESQNDFHRIEPSSRFREIGKPGWEKGKEGKGKCKCKGEAEHPDDGLQYFATSRFNKDGARRWDRCSEKETSTSVNAMKKAPVNPPLSACLSALFTSQLAG